MTQLILSLSNVSRAYGSIEALKRVDFEVRAGEVMGLVGENGAGKSSLLKIISGFDNGYSGTYTYRGRPVRFPSPDRAEEAGIAIAQQELSLIPSMSVGENIFLAGHVVPLFATKRRLAAKALPYLDAVGLGDIDPTRPIYEFSVGEQHLIEVARLIAQDPQVVVLDEPTAALSEVDSARVLHMVRRLKERGKSVIYVSHRMDEIFKTTDRVTVLRDGASHAPRDTSALDMDGLIELMLGRKIDSLFPGKRPAKNDNARLTVRNLWPDGLPRPLGFDLHAGEILGLAGQLGSGPSEILATLAGLHGARSGEIVYGGKRISLRSPRDTIAVGIGYCSSDRKKDGLFLARPILENLTAPAFERFSRLGFLSRSKERQLADGMARSFTIDTGRMYEASVVLSGGNQQKVALGKWLSIQPAMILIDEPTRGVDVGARAEIYGKIRALADSGASIIVASTDLQEITHLPDRVLAFYRGLNVGELSGGFSEVEILRLITDPFNEARQQG